MRRSESIAKISEAMAKAQGQIKNALRAAENPGFKRGNKASTYADLAAIWDACREPLSANGIAVFQPPALIRTADGPPAVTVTTLLSHGSGEWLESDLEATSETKPQAIGSTITYLRRYALAAMVGVAPEDDDGEAAMGRDTAAGRPEQPEQPRQHAPSQPKPAHAQEQAKVNVNAARDKQIFDDAIATGLTKEGFHQWAETTIGRLYAKNTDWTDKDRADLEAAIKERRIGSRMPDEAQP